LRNCDRDRGDEDGRAAERDGNAADALTTGVAEDSRPAGLGVDAQVVTRGRAR
jgi:hypothetical protein